MFTAIPLFKASSSRLIIIVACLLSIPQFQYAQTGRVGINTITPAASLHVADSSVVFTGPSDLPPSTGQVPVSGSGARMMWYSPKAAFRSGKVTGAQWDRDSIGIYSLASGLNTKALGNYTVALGQQTTANGSAAFATGRRTVASGTNSMAGGRETSASGQQSSAFGRTTVASGNHAFAMGLETTASGISSLALGFQTQAQLDNTVAMGELTTAGGINGVAMGALTFAGSNSLATGYETTATGGPSLSSGTGTQALGTNSFTSGNLSIASGNSSVAIGHGTNAIGENSFCSGFLSSAVGSNTAVFGTQNISNGSNSIAAGFLNIANGAGSIAMGNNNRTNGDYAMTLGTNLIVNNYGCLALGRYNDTTGMNSPNFPHIQEPVFVVGSGGVTSEGDVVRYNSFIITHQGKVGIGYGSNIPTENLEVNGSARIGNSGTTIHSIKQHNALANLPPILAGTSYTHYFIQIPAAGAVHVSPGEALPDGLLIAYARAFADGVEVKFYNASTGDIDVPEISYYFMSID